MTRQSAPRLHSMALYFAQQNCGKRNVSLDVTQTAGRDVARELSCHADVVLKNFRPGVMARLGLGYADRARRIHASYMRRSPATVRTAAGRNAAPTR